MTLSRRQFIQTAVAAGVGVGVAGTAALTLAAGTDYTYQGIDVASYQGYPNWTSVHDSGKTFAFTKATEGTGYTNPYFRHQLGAHEVCRDNPRGVPLRPPEYRPGCLGESVLRRRPADERRPADDPGHRDD